MLGSVIKAGGTDSFNLKSENNNSDKKSKYSRVNSRDRCMHHQLKRKGSIA